MPQIAKELSLMLASSSKNSRDFVSVNAVREKSSVNSSPFFDILLTPKGGGF